MAEWEKQESANFWQPEKKGDEIVGKVTEVITDGTYGVQYVILTDGGKEVMTPSHKVLQSRMKKAKVGTKVRIIYADKEPPKVKGQNPTEMYEVYFAKV